MKVLIAGIAGASLGTEIAKALRLAGKYELFGCDISPLAFGHYDQNFDKTVVVDRANYIEELLRVCLDLKVEALIAGADQTASLISDNAAKFGAEGILLCQNSASVVRVSSDKAACFEQLAQVGIEVPRTRLISNTADLDGFPMPCIVKPARDSGGSSYVFFARDGSEADLYCRYLNNNGKTPIAQAYLDHSGGEYTIGVLSLADGSVAGSIALRRSFTNKLSIGASGTDFIISSGYSQGEVRDFPEIRRDAEAVAQALGSVGPLNVQARLSQSGRLIPFEVNPRFSATTYLRAMAGFHEVDYFLRHLKGEEDLPNLTVKPGWYFRTLAEAHVETLVERG